MKNQYLEVQEDNPKYQIVENELQLKDYFLIIRIHLKKIILIFISFLMVGVYSTFSKVPKYRSTASVIISQKPGSQSLEGFTSADRTNQLMNNKMSLLKSRALMKLVVEQFWESERKNNMFLFGTRKYFPKGQTVRTLVKEILTLGLYDVNESNKSINHTGPYTDEIGDQYSRVLQSNLSIYRQGNTNIINIAYVSTNADEARRIANTIVAKFIQKDKEPTKRIGSVGLQAVFKKVFPITDFSGIAELRFVKYELEEPRYDVDECIQRGGTYGSLLRVTLNLIVREVDEETGVSSVKDIKEQDVYLGDMPLMTSKGTFVFNGTTRAVVSQMHRSPGVFFDHDNGKGHPSGKLLYSGRQAEIAPFNKQCGCSINSSISSVSSIICFSATSTSMCRHAVIPSLDARLV